MPSPSSVLIKTESAPMPCGCLRKAVPAMTLTFSEPLSFAAAALTSSMETPAESSVLASDSLPASMAAIASRRAPSPAGVCLTVRLAELSSFMPLDEAIIRFMFLAPEVRLKI